jgi:hypothetical protein
MIDNGPVPLSVDEFFQLRPVDEHHEFLKGCVAHWRSLKIKDDHIVGMLQHHDDMISGRLKNIN